MGGGEELNIERESQAQAQGQEPKQALSPHQEEKIFVSVRLRPLNEKELYRNEVSDWECINNDNIIFKNTLPERSMFPSAYAFDRVFGCDSPTKKVYEEAAKEVALSVVSGINSSIFAYGQTSSGKTYTMSGVTEYAVDDIYDYIERHNEREFQLKFSAIEIYNEAVRDLLSSDSTPLRLLDDPERGTVIEKLTEEILEDRNHLLELLSICEAQRQIGETSLNETSSRSHQILRLTVESSARAYLGAGNSSSLTATVNFVDLAGSERASQTLSAGARLKEGCHINRSLLTLGTVIRKLSKGKNGHIPYRDSKLTRILQNSLGGNARTAIICTMSPARSHVEQSRNTLLFASCAKEVSTNAQVNVVMSDKALVKQLQRELARLESEMRSLGSAPVSGNSSKLLREKELQIEKMDKEIKELTRQRDVAQAWVENLLHSAGEDRFLRQDEYSALEKSNEANPLGTKNDTQVIEIAEDNFLLDDSTPKFVGLDPCEGWEDIDQRPEGGYADVCKEVRCVEVKDLSMNKKTDADAPPSTSPEKNDGKSSMTEAMNGDAVSSPRKTDKELSHTHASPQKGDRESDVIGTDYTRALQRKIQELQTTINYLVTICPLQQSPCSSEMDTSSSRSLNFSRSRSCRPNLSNNPSPNRMEKSSPGGPGRIYRKLSEIKNGAISRNLSRKSSESSISSMDSQSIRELHVEKDSPGKPVGYHQKLSQLNYGSDVGELSRSYSHNSISSVEEKSIKESDVEDRVNHCDSVFKSNEVAKLSSEKQPVENLIQDAALKSDHPGKNTNSSDQPLSSWPLEFEKQRREIIELWVTCNVPLVHRTYFFLLFKGDPSDSVYLEVELRRLSFLKDTFSRGARAPGDSRLVTSASSSKDLNRERAMLSKQIQRKISRKDREALYQKWGIGLKTKQRSLQLAHRLWTDTTAMEHIKDSAALVAKLIGFVEPGQAPKEIFGLSFLSRPPISRRSYSWKNSMSPML